MRERGKTDESIDVRVTSSFMGGTYKHKQKVKKLFRQLFPEYISYTDRQITHELVRKTIADNQRKSDKRLFCLVLPLKRRCIWNWLHEMLVVIETVNTMRKRK